MIDLHLHTTASDGRSTPTDLVRQVRAVGIRTFAVTDHDTVAALEATSAIARQEGLAFVPGVEITAVDNGKDVHVLGYFVDFRAPSLLDFLEASRADRLRRARLMCETLAQLGAPLDFGALLASTGGPNSGQVIARPVVAQALVDAGHVRSVQEAFDKYLAEGQPAYFGRIGASPVDVVRIIRNAGGLASLAHPGPLGRDELVEPLVEAGLAAVECFHSEHTAAITAKYLDLARRFDLAVTGGSDFHGVGAHRSEFLGKVSLPREHFEVFAARAAGVR